MRLPWEPIRTNESLRRLPTEQSCAHDEVKMFNDPMKLIPLVGSIGVLVLIGFGKLNANDAILLLTAITGIHAAISAVNNTPKS